MIMAGKNKNVQYSEANLKKAVEDIRSGELSHRVAAKKYGVPRTTLERKLNNVVIEKCKRGNK